MEADRLEKFKHVLEQMKENPLVVILTHLDPDSMASAEAMRFIAKSVGIEQITVLYCDESTDEQNEAIINKLALDRRMQPIDSWVDFPAGNNYVMVDANSPSDSRLKHAKDKLKLTMVIDHHRNDKIKETDDDFIWLENFGACATMMCELIAGLGLLSTAKFNGDFKDLPLLLSLGIYMDTKGLISAGSKDREAFAEVAGLAKEADLQFFINYQISQTYMEALKCALNSMSVRGMKIVAYAGEVSSKEATVIARVADFFIRIKGFSLAVVWATVDDSQIMVSARGTDFGTPLDEFIRSRFGSGGAKVSKWGLWEGGVQLPFNFGFFHSPINRMQRIATAQALITGLILEN
ncbi:MAG: DHH family phosphoesterase [Patescibacteria group bacterium]|jgi:nanoRNase/pAp phosphatase (c-di-AMP/oligoRNAs hydrolase)